LLDPAAWPRHDFLRNPVSHGPYRVVEWTPGERIRLVRYGPHPLGTPRIREIVFRFFTGPADLRDAVRDGSVDITELSGFSVADAVALERSGEHVRVAQVPSSMWEHASFNLDDRHLSDVRVRRAIAYAIDRDALAETLYQGRCAVAHTWLPPRHPAHNDSVRRYAYDPRKARALLAEAGYVPGPDGVLRDPSGDPLSLHLLTTRPAPNGRWSASTLREAAADLMAQQLHGVGIELRPEAVATDEAFRRFRARDFPHLAMFAWSIGLETNGYLMWHSSQVPRHAGSYGINVPGWRSPTNDRILGDIIAEGDPDAREALMREQQVEWAEHLPSLPLFFLPQVNAYHRALRNIEYVGAFGTYVTWNAWRWAWEEKPAP
jgi:peptide/nickel transport system substrate-binding protein